MSNWSFPRHRDYERALRKTAASWFADKNLAVQRKYAYILARHDMWPQNIILPEVVQYIQDEKKSNEEQKKSYPLHKYLHHGLSSQAMLFNLVGPLIVRHDLEPLKIVFEHQGICWPVGKITAEFEFDDRSVFNETRGQPTSIDLLIRNESGTPKIFVEAKLVEKEFGGCSLFAGGDCDGSNPARDFPRCFLHHIGRRYWPLMEKHGFLDGPLSQDTTCIMTSYYQFFREVLLAFELGGSFVLLCDRRSPAFAHGDQDTQRGLFSFLVSLLPQPARDRVKSVALQDVIRAIHKTERHEWIGEFEKKYGIIQGV